MAQSADKAAASGLGHARWLDGLLLAGLLLAMLYGIGKYGLYEPHEAHFAGVGREMLLRGDFVTPHLNGDPYLNKPPLLYWMIAGSYALFGINEFAARLPLALVGWLGVVLAWRWATELWGLKAGRYAALMLAVAAGWYLFCHQLMIDALLTTVLLACAYCLWRISLDPQRVRGWVLFYLAVAAGVMCKGVVGLVLPLGVLLAYCACRRDATLLRRSRPGLGALIVLGLVLPWLIMLESRNPGTIGYMLGNELWNRIFDKRDPPDYSVVKVSVWAYIAVTLIWLAPWSLVLPQVARFGWANRGASKRQPPSTVENGVLLLGLAALLPVVMFLPIPARLIYYSLPTLPPFVILAAGWWSQMSSAHCARGRKIAGVTYLVTGLTLCVLGLNLGSLISGVHFFELLPNLPNLIQVLAVCLGVALSGAGILLLTNEPAWSLGTLATALIMAGVLNIHGFTQTDDVWSAKKLVGHLQAMGAMDEQVVWISEGSQEIGGSAGLSYYLGQDASGQARTVLVMEDDPRRRPPRFPVKPKYLIRQIDLIRIWRSEQPALFVTDFQRDWRNFEERPNLPSKRARMFILPCGGNRRVFANEAACRRFPQLSSTLSESEMR